LLLYTAEGVIYAKKDFNLPAHPEIKEVPNLQVRKRPPPQPPGFVEFGADVGVLGEGKLGFGALTC